MLYLNPKVSRLIVIVLTNLTLTNVVFEFSEYHRNDA